MVINGKEVKHITIRIGENGDDVIYIGENEIINMSENLTVHIRDGEHNRIIDK